MLYSIRSGRVIAKTVPAVTTVALGNGEEVVSFKK
jgi:hypothetical protein